MATANSNFSGKMAALDIDDLLSDDSNDSFFEDPKLLAKRGSLTKTAEKKSVADIFGFSEGKKPEADWLGLDGAKKPKEEAKKVSFEGEDAEILSSLGIAKKGETKPETKKKHFDEDDDDILTSLGFGKSKQTTNVENPAIKKAGLFDDILGGSPKKEKKKVEFGDESKQKQEVIITTRESRRTRSGASSSIADPLGLFTAETKDKRQPDEAGDAGKQILETIAPPVQTKSAPNITELPNWLADVKQNKSEPEIAKPERETPILDDLIAQQKLASVNVGLQNTAIAMQQQETQLVVALQLKKYEEKLAELQGEQREILLKQDRLFNDLLQKQFSKQQVLEDNMRQQQQRIQNHIETLMGTSNYVSNEDELKKSKENETVKLYEEMITTLKQRQSEEVFLLEESYKKQINLLEQSMQSLENRLKTDLETAVETYQNKIKESEEHYKQEILKYKSKLEEMSEQQASEIKMIRENHLRVIDEIKNEYSLLAENLKHTKNTETYLLTNAGEYTEKLEKNLTLLSANSKALQDIQGTVEKSSGTFYATREENIKAKEEEIRLMRQALEKAREAAETERAQLMSLVRTLEMKIVEQNQNAREERWALQQATATLTAKASALDREADFNRALLEREREQIKTLKESVLAEQERNMLFITEQRLTLEAEKSRLETAAKLNKNHDPQIARAEIDAAIQVAKEAAELTDRDREKLQRQQYELESLKRNILDKERKLSLKEREFEMLAQKSEAKIRESEKAMDSAKLLEIKYNERMRELQNQMVSLTNRERKLTEEKIELSRERLALHTMARQNRKCGLCAVDDNNTKNEEYFVEPDLHNFSMVESNIHRIRLEFDESNNEDFIEPVHKDT